MTVNHGNETKHEVARGKTFEVCLAYLSNTDLYKGYGPRLDQMRELRYNRGLSYGWAEFLLVTDKQMEALVAWL